MLTPEYRDGSEPDGRQPPVSEATGRNLTFWSQLRIRAKPETGPLLAPGAFPETRILVGRSVPLVSMKKTPIKMIRQPQYGYKFTIAHGGQSKQHPRPRPGMGQAAQELTLKLITRRHRMRSAAAVSLRPTARMLRYLSSRVMASFPCRTRPTFSETATGYFDFRWLGPLILSKHASTFSVVRNSALF